MAFTLPMNIDLNTPELEAKRALYERINPHVKRGRRHIDEGDPNDLTHFYKIECHVNETFKQLPRIYDLRSRQGGW